MRLFHKFYVTFILSSVLVVTLAVGVMHYFVSEHFTSYVASVELLGLGGIVEALKDEYRQNSGWGNIRNNRLLWDQIVRKHQPEGSEDDPPVHRGPPPPGMPRYEDPSRPLPPPAPFLTRRLTLYDDEQRFVLGRSAQPKEQDVLKMDIGGRTIGWLGLSRSVVLRKPLQLKFIYEETRAHILIGLGTLILGVLSAFVLSRQMLRPVRQITAGAHALASRQFEVRLDVHSEDELGKLASDFNTMAATLERYESMRRQWIADISHELRTPLTILRGEIEALLDGVRDMRRETLESIHTEIMLLSKIINDLHTLTIIESEFHTVTKEPVDVVAIALNILEIFRPRFSERGIEVQSEMLPVGKGAVLGDPDRLAQLFSNIFENCLRYTDPPGKVRIRSEERDGALLLDIEDSAPSVPDSAIPLLFDRLYRVDRSRSRKEGGSGLGMAIVKTIVDGHNGQITAKHSPLGGLRIEIMLPLVTGG